MTRMAMAKLLWKVYSWRKSVYKRNLNYYFSYQFLKNEIEYISACRRNGSTTSDESLTQAFRTFDADGDGEIFLDEFIAAVKFINEQKNL